MVNRKTKMTTNRKTSKTLVSSSRTKIIAGAVGLAVVAGSAGYAINEITNPTSIASPDPVYTVTYYKLKKAKLTLSELKVRANNTASEKYNSNGYVPTNWADTNNSGCKTRYDILFG